MRALLAFLPLLVALLGSGSADAVEVRDESWTDAVRQRTVPVRIRLPDATGRVPTILFSHGLGGSVSGGREWGEHWAGQGFAVIHVQHPGSDESLWRDKPSGERLASLRSGAGLEQFLARTADIRFVVAELGRRRSARFDLSRLGMSGHSFGAITTLYLGGQRPPPGIADFLAPNLAEPAFKAFLALSPQVIGVDPVHQFSRFMRPALLVTGTQDGSAAFGVTPEQRLVPFEAMPATGNKHLLVIDGANHMFFNGEGRPGEGHALVNAVSTAYWRAYLQDDGEALRWLRERRDAFKSK